MSDTPIFPPQGNVALSPTSPVVINSIRFPLQGNVRLSSVQPVVTNFPSASIVIIAEDSDPVIVIDDDVTNSVEIQ